MTDQPIIFSAPMVRALLDGRKTMTRRIIKLPTKGEYVRPDMGGWEATTVGGGGCFDKDGRPVPEMVAIWNQTTGTCITARYQPGDRLYVREAWSGDHSLRDVLPSERLLLGNPSRLVPLIPETWYWADGGPEHGDWEKPRPSIHMPRWASRLTLVVTSVKIERLQDISKEDAEAEGVDIAVFDMAPAARNYMQPDGWFIDWSTLTREQGYCDSDRLHRESFRTLWQSLHGADAWDADPYVVALTFTVHKTNIDAMPETADSPTALTDARQ